MNSEKMHSVQREVKTFDKFDFTIQFGIVTETHRKWIRVFKDQQDKIWSEEEILAAQEAKTLDNIKFAAEWVPTEEQCISRYVEFATRIDPTMDHPKGLPIEVWTTVESPILGTVLPADSLDPEYRSLLDPCAVLYDGKSRVNLMPIFNVARVLKLRRDSVKTITPPNEILVGLYPGFVLQNRMSQYQLKPKAPFETSPVLSNTATDKHIH